MQEDAYIYNILNGLGFAINEEKNNEIFVNYPIIFNRKNMQYSVCNKYTISTQPLGTFLADFLNSDFNEYNDFFIFFNKYSLSLVKNKEMQKIFQTHIYDKLTFENIMTSWFNKIKHKLLGLQEQVDMILDYCLINPKKSAKNFSPLQRLFVLHRLDHSLTLLIDNKILCYPICVFSSNPGNSEEDIYNFLASKRNKVSEVNLLLPDTLSSILYKSLVYVLSEQILLKNCKNCDRYFIANTKSSEYCNNIAPNSTKTCKQIGKISTFKNNLQNDSLLSLYYKIYNRKLAMKLRYKDIIKYEDDFNLFKQIGKSKLEKYKNGKLSAEAFKKWLKKNS